MPQSPRKAAHFICSMSSDPASMGGGDEGGNTGGEAGFVMGTSRGAGTTTEEEGAAGGGEMTEGGAREGPSCEARGMSAMFTERRGETKPLAGRDELLGTARAWLTCPADELRAPASASAEWCSMVPLGERGGEATFASFEAAALLLLVVLEGMEAAREMGEGAMTGEEGRSGPEYLRCIVSTCMNEVAMGRTEPL